MTDQELSEIEARCAAAQPGPWRSFVEGRDHWGGSNFIKIGDDDCADDLEFSGATVADQDFIASARQDVPRLLAEIRRLKELLRE